MVIIVCQFSIGVLGSSGGAMVVGKLPVPGRPTYLDNTQRAQNVQMTSY